MQANKGRDTTPERALRSAAHALGLRYRVSTRPIPQLRRTDTADMVFSRARVAVFLDGCFWHGCPDHHTQAATNARFWADKVESNRQRDADTDKQLTDAGWLVVRVWEHEDPIAAALRVAKIVKTRPVTSRSRADGIPNTSRVNNEAGTEPTSP
jgi:DNA mismatch endonuclease (patch repair protein)